MVIPTINSNRIIYKDIPREYRNIVSTFENVATPKTYVRKLHGVEKGLYRLNYSRELQKNFLQALYNYQNFLRRA